MTTREQGDWGEFWGMMWLKSRGFPVFVPLGHSPHYDFIADLDGRVVRVQVKTSGVVSQGSLGDSRVHPRRQPELERSYETPRSVAVRLPLDPRG